MVQGTQSLLTLVPNSSKFFCYIPYERCYTRPLYDKVADTLTRDTLLSGAVFNTNILP